MADEVRRRQEGLPCGHVLGEPVQAGLAAHLRRPLGPVLRRLRGRGHDHLPAHRLVVDTDRDRSGAPIDIMITLTPLNTMEATDLLWSQVLRKFPNLKFALSEGGTGWLPYWLERIDYVYQQHRFWTGQDFGDALPSQVARDHFTFCQRPRRRRRARGDRHRQHDREWTTATPTCRGRTHRSPSPSSSTASRTTSSTRSPTRTRPGSSATTRSRTVRREQSTTGALRAEAPG